MRGSEGRDFELDLIELPFKSAIVLERMTLIAQLDQRKRQYERETITSRATVTSGEPSNKRDLATIQNQADSELVEKETLGESATRDSQMVRYQNTLRILGGRDGKNPREENTTAEHLSKLATTGSFAQRER
ncbi:hypothetical protein ACLOJK_036570 [Asimina triloba]